MSIPRFYHASGLAPGAGLTLSERVAHHVVNVLRLTSGDKVVLFDGTGREFMCVINGVHKRVCTVKVESISEINVESPLHISLLQGISRTDRMDYALQKSVELGVSEIFPIQCDHSSINVQGERGDKKLQHWRGVVAGACEQCKRSVLPQVHGIQSFAEWLGAQQQTSEVLRLALDPQAETSLKRLADHRVQQVAVFIGPEGGISPRELELAQLHGFQSIRLGPRVLRTETATIAILSQLQMLWGDLN